MSHLGASGQVNQGLGLHFPLTIQRVNGSDGLYVVRAFPTGKSKPDRTAELRGVVEGELAGWLRRRKERA